MARSVRRRERGSGPRWGDVVALLLPAIHEAATLAASLTEVLAEAFPHSLPASREALASAAGVRVYRTGETILEQGDESWLALVLDGYVAIRRTTVDGRQLILRIVTRAELPEILPLAARPAAASVVALARSPAAVWRGDEPRSLAATDPGLALDILDHALASFDAVTGRVDSLLYQDALRRVARVLDVHAGLFFAARPVLTLAHLPTMVGTSREMTGRVLRILEARHVVARVGRHRLRLLDRAGLAAIADTGTIRATARGTSSSS